MAKLLTLKKKAYECYHWLYQEQFQGSAFSKQLTNIWLINFYIKHRMQEEMLQLLSLVASTRTPSFILLGAARSPEFSWFCCCRSDGNTPTQLGEKKRNESFNGGEKRTDQLCGSNPEVAKMSGWLGISIKCLHGHGKKMPPAPGHAAICATRRHGDIRLCFPQSRNVSKINQAQAK